ADLSCLCGCAGAMCAILDKDQRASTSMDAGRRKRFPAPILSRPPGLAPAARPARRTHAGRALSVTLKPEANKQSGKRLGSLPGAAPMPVGRRWWPGTAAIAPPAQRRRRLLDLEARHRTLLIETFGVNAIFTGFDRHEEQRGLALAFHLDLIEAGSLDLDVADLDLAQPDEIEKFIAVDRVLALAGGNDRELVGLAGRQAIGGDGDGKARLVDAEHQIGKLLQIGGEVAFRRRRRGVQRQAEPVQQ